MDDKPAIEPPLCRNANGPSWKVRRRIIIITLLFCAIEVAYLTLYGESTALNESIATGCLLLAGSVIGSYVFGAVWDDGKRKDVQPPGRR